MEAKETVLKQIKNLSECQTNVGKLKFTVFSDGVFTYQRYDDDKNGGYQRYFNLEIITDDDLLDEETIDDLLIRKRISYINGSMCLLNLEKNTYEKLECYTWNINQNMN